MPDSTPLKPVQSARKVLPQPQMQRPHQVVIGRTGEDDPARVRVILEKLMKLERT